MKVLILNSLVIFVLIYPAFGETESVDPEAWVNSKADVATQAEPKRAKENIFEFGFGLISFLPDESDGLRDSQMIVAKEDSFQFDAVGSLLGYEMTLDYRIELDIPLDILTGIMLRKFGDVQGNSLGSDSLTFLLWGDGRCGKSPDHCKSLDILLAGLTLGGRFFLGKSTFVGIYYRFGEAYYRAQFGYDEVENIGQANEQRIRSIGQTTAKGTFSLLSISIGYHNPKQFFSGFYWEISQLDTVFSAVESFTGDEFGNPSMIQPKLAGLQVAIGTKIDLF